MAEYVFVSLTKTFALTATIVLAIMSNAMTKRAVRFCFRIFNMLSFFTLPFSTITMLFQHS